MKYPKALFKRCASILVLYLAGVVAGYGQATDCIPEKPDLQTSVYDYTNTLSETQKRTLERKLINYSDSTSTQIVVALAQDLCGEDIALLATEWAHRWGIGQKDKDNGVFMLVCPPQRKLFIATGYGVEGRLTDAMTRRIIETRILPEFRNGDYYAGIDAGVNGIFEALAGEFHADPKEMGFNPGSILTFLIVFLVIAVIIIVAIAASDKNQNGGKNNNNGTGGGKRASDTDALLTGILLGSMGRGLFGGGHSGSASGGFGGGGFGGGGAGGSW